MSAKEAIGILMLSPVYFLWTPEERLVLVKEYIETFEQVLQEKKI